MGAIPPLAISVANGGAVAFITPAFADAIAPTAFFLPGCLFMALGAALPATVLAGALERPFVTRAGVKRHALCYSLQANTGQLVIKRYGEPL